MKKDHCLHRQTKLLLLLIACFLFAAPFSYAQNATLSIAGRVADSKNLPITGATVAVEGSKAATATDANGAFKINAAKGAVLHITAIGYQEFKVKVESDKSLSVIMKEDDAKMMNDVVVVGYGTQKRSDVTGAVVSVPKARLSELPVTNVYQAIQGVVAGMNVTSGSSVPGSTPSVNIRGQNSVNASTEPFVVVDGVPLTKTGGSINDINPNDIASVEILKDASAVAIYGVNGSSGVILITTKRGGSGKAQIRYNGYYGTEDIAHILKPREGASYVQKWKDYNAQSGLTPQYDVPNIAELPYYNSGQTTDWMDVVTRQGIIQDHNLSISGGNKDVKYYVSGDYLNEKGPLIGFNYKRVSIRSNLDINITDFLTVGTSLFFANNNYDGGRINMLNATAMSPYAQVTDANGQYIIYPMYAELLYTNPMLPQYTDQVNRSTNVNGNGYAEIKFPGALKGLKFRLNGAYTYLPTLAGSYVGRMANDLNGTASKTNTQTRSYIVENILSYTKDFGKHHIDFTGLYSAQQKLFDSTRGGAVGFINDQLSFNNLGAGATQTSASFANQYRINSQMARVNYSYDSRYMITATVRRDGSSLMGANTDKYGVFPSVGFGWNISNEKFMKGLQAINSLKLRGSYGKTGNEAIPGPYQTITKDKLARYPFNGLVSTGVVADNLGNSNLHWETTKGLNLGIDFAVLNSRISGSIDAYHTQTDGIILNRNIPVMTGFTSVYDNIGKLDNKGFEVTLNTKNIVTNDFRWESIINFSRNKNKWVDIYGDGKSDVGNKWFIGQPVGIIYDYQMTGIWQEGEDASKQDPSAKPGFIKFADINHDGKITADSDRVVQGQTAPKWLGGFTNTFHYKNFHLSIFLQTVQGVTKNDNDLNYVDESGRRNTPQEVGYWTAANKSQEFPALTTAANTGRRGYAYPRDASYTRLKDITLSYTFSQRLVDKLKLGSVTAYASGRNLYTWTKWIGWDPENNVALRGTGTDGTLGSWTNNYPTIRSFVFGLNVSLK
ncbi:SusC/RagA family TonB-linked outer membrane protein [Pinibacter aurantiacus]|uniref:TonB-dependent receptor n=1 Tax=Pinibacter aurantiacus TaxID=2851599 RepID=A0A9E2SBS1_9BACT|nr:TonB-dependent receptor [Pinibacter aurantiacus]MBV4359232.1 TonB-dependent receptor [Pinibacter aurantiacus]